MRFLTLPMPLRALLLAAIASHAVAAIKPPDEVVADGIPPIPSELQASLEKYQNVRGARLIGWMGDEGLLISTRFGQTSQLHLVRRPGGARTQLTFAEEPVRFARPAPTYSLGIVFGHDQRGGEAYQLYRYDTLSATVTPLTTNEARNSDPVWARSGELLAFASTARNNRDSDILLMDLASDKIQPVVQRAGTWYPLDFSPDEAQLLVARFVSINDIRLYLVNLNNLELQRLDPDAFPASQPQAAFAPDGSGIWFISDREQEYTSLRFVNLETNAVSEISDTEHDVSHFAVSRNGNWVAYVVNENGLDRLHMYDVRRRKARQLPQSLNDVGTRNYEMAFSPDDSTLAMSLGAPGMPGDVFTLNTRDLKLTRWTTSELGALRDYLPPLPELIHYPTFDNDFSGRRRLIPAFYYRPRTEGPHPVVIWAHGGPESQSRPSFRSTLYYMLNELNIAVITPNVRGSLGYGKNFLRLDDAFRREDAVRDIGSLLDWISSHSELDYRKVGMMGGSYGGYLTLAAMVRYRDRVRAGAAIAPIADFVSFLENLPDYRRDLRRQEYGDERDPQTRAFLARISPRRQISQLNAPLLLVQGQNDPRVPATQTSELVQQIRRNDGTVWYLLAANEGHGFSRKGNHNFYQAVLGQFWRKHLLGIKEDLPEEDPSL